MDAERTGKPVAVVEGVEGRQSRRPTRWPTTAGRARPRGRGDTATCSSLADTPTGFFAKIEPCAALAPGERLAPLNAALLAFLDREYGAGLRRRRGRAGPALRS